MGQNAQAISSEYREGEFNKWKQLSQRGIGVLWNDKCTLTNAWVSNKGGLSSGKWTNRWRVSAFKRHLVSEELHLSSTQNTFLWINDDTVVRKSSK